MSRREFRDYTMNSGRREICSNKFAFQRIDAVPSDPVLYASISVDTLLERAKAVNLF